MQAMTDHHDGRTIRVAAAALQVIGVEALASLDGAETGGILLGRSTATDTEVLVQHAGGPGPSALRTPTRFDRDLQHARRLAEFAWHMDGSQWIGEWHTHPVGPMVPSDRDLSSYRAHLSDVELGFRQFVCVIVGLHEIHGVTLCGWIVRPTDLVPAKLIAEGEIET